MPFVASADGCAIHYEEAGAGPPIVLVHGFASTLERNWRETGWMDALAKAGRRAVAYDLRGHGESDDRYEPEDYGPERLLDDLEAVIAATGIIEAAPLMGYSMGGQIVLDAAVRRPALCRALLLGGVGVNFFPELGGTDRRFDVVARALEADDPSGFPPFALGYRTFAEKNRQDGKALAACWRRPRRPPTLAELARVRAPALVVVGDRDETSGDAGPLARAIPDAELVVLEKKDHMTAVGARRHREAVLDFLARS